MRSILTCTALAALTAFLIAATAAVCIVTEIVKQIPQQVDAQIQATRAELLQEVDATRTELLQRVDALGVKADARLDHIEKDLNSQLTRTIDRADSYLARTAGQVDMALAEAHTINASLAPIVAHVGNITAHADEASAILFRRDALPAQILGVLGATKVTMGETAQAMKVVRDSAPQVAASTIETAKSIAGIAADIHTVTSEYLKPKTFWGKVWGATKTAGFLFVRTL